MSLVSVPSTTSVPRQATRLRTVVAVLDDDAVAQGLTNLRSRLTEVLSAGDARLVVDVSGLDRISSNVVAALLRAKRKCAARGVDVVVRGSAGQSLGLLTRTGLAAVLDVEDGEV
ncbi:MAG: STAS domain-containing protein [Angustibacter sp.]